MKILVIARKKGFWTTRECSGIFSKVILLRANPFVIEQYIIGLFIIIFSLFYRPDVFIFGTSTKIVTIFSVLKRIGLFKKVKCITDKQYLPVREAEMMDKIVVYSPGEINQYPENLRDKFIFLHYPSKTELVDIDGSRVHGQYIFCGGNNMRDHASFIESIKELAIKVVVVTDKKLPDNLPPNCEIFGRLPLHDYMNLMAGSLFVVAPLLPSDSPHGHCDISSALSLGKPVVTTKGASVDEYIEYGKNGLLVEPLNVADYKEKISLLVNNNKYLNNLSEYAGSHIADFSYKSFGSKLMNIIYSV